MDCAVNSGNLKRYTDYARARQPSPPNCHPERSAGFLVAWL